MAEAAPSGLAAHLRPGEVLLWHGAPDAGLRLKPAREDIEAGLWGLGATALLALLAWAIGAFGRLFPILRAGVVAALLALLALSLHPLLLKHRLLMHRLRRTRYALTNRRALVLTGTRRARLLSLELRPDTQLALSEDTPPTLSLWHWPENAHRETLPEEIHFRYLSDPRTPHRIARQILQEMS